MGSTSLVRALSHSGSVENIEHLVTSTCKDRHPTSRLDVLRDRVDVCTEVVGSGPIDVVEQDDQVWGPSQDGVSDTVPTSRESLLHLVGRRAGGRIVLA